MMPDDFSLRDLGEPPEASYETVRRRVMGEIRRQRRVRNAMRMVAVAAACVVLAVAGLLALRPGAGTVVPPMLARAPGPPELSPVTRNAQSRLLARAARSVTTTRAATARKRWSSGVLPRAPAQELVVRMQTDDPNVVIIWMVD